MTINIPIRKRPIASSHAVNRVASICRLMTPRLVHPLSLLLFGTLLLPGRTELQMSFTPSVFDLLLQVDRFDSGSAADRSRIVEQIRQSNRRSLIAGDLRGQPLPTPPDARSHPHSPHDERNFPAPSPESPRGAGSAQLDHPSRTPDPASAPVDQIRMPPAPPGSDNADGRQPAGVIRKDGPKAVIKLPSWANAEPVCMLNEGTDVAVLGEQPDPVIKSLIFRRIKVLSGPHRNIVGYIASSGVEMKEPGTDHIVAAIHPQKKAPKLSWQTNRNVPLSSEPLMSSACDGAVLPEGTPVKVLDTLQDKSGNGLGWHSVTVTDGTHRGKKGWLPATSLKAIKKSIVLADPEGHLERRLAARTAKREGLKSYTNLRNWNGDLSDIDRVVIQLHGNKGQTAPPNMTRNRSMEPVAAPEPIKGPTNPTDQTPLGPDYIPGPPVPPEVNPPRLGPWLKGSSYDAQEWASFLVASGFDGSEVEFIACHFIQVNNYQAGITLSRLMQGVEVISWHIPGAPDGQQEVTVHEDARTGRITVQGTDHPAQRLSFLNGFKISK